LYQITNPQGEASNGIGTPVNPPACQTDPLCSHPVCDTTKSIPERVASLVNSLTEEEKILNLIDSAGGSARLGLPAYEWWSEATHGVGSAPGTFFPKPPADFNYATSFPAPILTAASFDGALMKAIGRVVGTEGRAFGNHGFAGFDFWAPNMNPFRDPRWGRGQETPGEDVFVVQTYIRNFVPGMQGDSPDEKLTIATCKHYAAYDLETGRTGNDYDPTHQDISDYFLKPFKTCVRDTNVGSIMCSYNAVYGVPTCASEYLMEDVLRDYWNFTADYNYVVSDCSSVTDIWQWHNFTDTEEGAAAIALNAGVDLECGTSFLKLNQSLALNHTTTARMNQALTRLYSALFSVGYFDGNQYSQLTWTDVSTPSSEQLAYQAAVEGMTLLKNDGTLPISDSRRYKTVALIGPYANATTQMQGDYSGTPPYLRSPLYAFQKHGGWKVQYAMGTDINTQNSSGFAAAVSAAQSADVVIYCGGIDGSIENEGHDRVNLTWPGNQLDLISQLSQAAHNKPLIVAQFGGGQVDDTPLLQNRHVNALLWAGYPSQDGGTALVDILTGKQAPAGRLPVTQYPASYADEVSIFNINLRPNGSFPGRTYQWYTGKPVFPFGYGLHYTHFEADFEGASTLRHSYDIGSLINDCKSKSGKNAVNDNTPFATISATISNVGGRTSDYSALLFLSSEDAGPTPRPKKTLVAFQRAHGIRPGDDAKVQLALTLGSLARADENGAQTIYPGTYQLAIDVDERATVEFRLTGKATVIEILPLPKKEYSFAVPVHYQPPSTESHGQG
jgi:xylan 1,4-beta-xylosidase